MQPPTHRSWASDNSTLPQYHRARSSHLAWCPSFNREHHGLPRFGGKELFYVTMSNRLMAAQIHTQPTFGVDSIRPMFQLDFPNLPDRTLPLFDVSADGQRFAVLTGDRAKTTTITLLTSWPAELKK